MNRTDWKKHDPWCEPCIYYARSCMSCDYILIEDKMRPCPAGKGCTARRTRRRENGMKKPKWDTELGRLMWLEGKKDGEIADAFGIPTSSVTSYRTRHWQKELIRVEDSPLTEEPKEPTAPEAVSPEAMQELKQEVKEEIKLEDNKNVRTQLHPYEVLEAATAGMTGIRAICTADAILCLWNWDTREDLEKAKAAIEYLLKKEERL